jgi:hypothetical protein
MVFEENPVRVREAIFHVKIGTCKTPAFRYICQGSLACGASPWTGWGVTECEKRPYASGIRPRSWTNTSIRPPPSCLVVCFIEVWRP